MKLLICLLKVYFTLTMLTFYITSMFVRDTFHISLASSISFYSSTSKEPAWCVLVNAGCIMAAYSIAIMRWKWSYVLHLGYLLRF